MALSRKPQEIVEGSSNPLLGKHESWGRVPVDEIADILNGYAFKSTKFTRDKGTPLIRIRDVGKSSTKTFYDGEFDETYLVKDGDLLIGMDGDFRCSIWKGGEALLNQRVCKISLKSDNYNFKFLSYVLQPYLDAIHAETSAVTVKHLSSRSVSEIPLPLPPLEQQKRIVAKIEELFSHIDAGIKALKKAKQLLKQYRQSVLKAAVTGELTKDWREANKDKLEPAAQLLERILKERRQKWEEQQLEQFKVKEKMPKDDKWKDKYKEPELGANRFFTEIPEEWAIASVDHATRDVRYGSSSKTNEDGKGVPVLRMGNIIDGKLDYSKLKYLPVDHNEFPDLLLDDGDLLFNRTNSAELVGKTAVYRDTGKQTSLASYLIRVRMLSGIESDFVAFFINSSCGRNWIKNCVSQNVGQANVNGTKLKALVLPLPSHEEQKEIVKCVEEKIQASDRLSAELDLQLLKAGKNKQSILASAFNGVIN